MAVDLKASLELALGNLTATMGKVSDGLDAIHKYMSANPRQAPIVRPIQASGTSDGSTYFAITLGGPAAGRVWDVRRIAIWKAGVNPFPTVSGVQVIYAVASSPVQGRGFTTIPTLQDMGLAPGSVPNDAEYNVHQFTIRFPQQVSVILTGTGNNDIYIVSGQAEEYIESMPERIIA